jgi:hypothetical protein
MRRAVLTVFRWFPKVFRVNRLCVFQRERDALDQVIGIRRVLVGYALPGVPESPVVRVDGQSPLDVATGASPVAKLRVACRPLSVPSRRSRTKDPNRKVSPTASVSRTPHLARGAAHYPYTRGTLSSSTEPTLR